MKKGILLFSIALFIFQPLLFAQNPNSKFSLKLSGGLAYLSNGGDMKELLASLNDQFEFEHSRGPWDYRYKPLGLDFDLEASYEFSPDFSFALGIGFIRKDWKPTFNQMNSWGSSYVLRTGNEEFEASAIPLTASVRWSHSFGKFNISIGGGPGIYLLKFNYDLKVRYTDPYNSIDPGWAMDETVSFQSHVLGRLGFQAGLGLDFVLSSRLSLIVEALYRTVKLDEIKGRQQWEDVATWTGGSDQESFSGDNITFWYVTRRNGNNFFHDFEMSENKLTGVYDIRPFELKLDGFALRAGIKIHL
jgi:hypothetical protein